MNSSNYRVRRATLDDINELSALWKSMNFPAEDLSKRITEFQVAESAAGKLIGALGLQIAARQGRVHSEAFSDFALAEQLRPLFWDRIHSVATNHGLLRLWTQEQAPFWNHCGLARADAETLEKLPAPWRNQSPVWLTLKLKEVFMESEKQQTQKTFQHARILKVVATLIAVAVLILILGAAFFMMRKNPGAVHL